MLSIRLFLAMTIALASTCPVFSSDHGSRKVTERLDDDEKIDPSETKKHRSDDNADELSMPPLQPFSIEEFDTPPLFPELDQMGSRKRGAEDDLDRIFGTVEALLPKAAPRRRVTPQQAPVKNHRLSKETRKIDPAVAAKLSEIQDKFTHNDFAYLKSILCDLETPKIVHTQSYVEDRARALDKFIEAATNAQPDRRASVIKFLQNMNNYILKDSRKQANPAGQIHIASLLLGAEDELYTKIHTKLTSHAKDTPNLCHNLMDIIPLLCHLPMDQFDQCHEIISNSLLDLYFSQQQKLPIILEKLTERKKDELANILKACYRLVLVTVEAEGSPYFSKLFFECLNAAVSVSTEKALSIFSASLTYFTDVKAVESKYTVSPEFYLTELLGALQKINNANKRERVAKAAALIFVDTVNRLVPEYEDDDEDAEFYSEEDTFHISPNAVIEALNRSKLSKLDQSLHAANTIVNNTKWSDKNYAEIVRTISNLNPERINDVIESASKINKTREHWSAERHIHALRALSKVPVELGPWIVDYCDIFMDHECSEELVKHVLARVHFVPASQSNDFRELAWNSSIDQNRPDYDDDLVAHAQIMKHEGEERQQELFNYWKELMSSENVDQVREVGEFVCDYFDVIGLDEENELVQMAIRVLTVLDNEDDTSPYVIYSRLKQKKAEPIDWTKLKAIKGGVEGLYVSLNHQKLANFGIALELDPKSVPNVTTGVLVRMLEDLHQTLENDYHRCLQSPDSREPINDVVKRDELPAIIQAAMMMRSETDQETDKVGHTPQESVADFLFRLGDPMLQLIKHRSGRGSNLCALLEGASANNLETAKLKCVVNYLHQLPVGSDKTRRLSQFMAGLAPLGLCAEGHRAAINSYYKNLPLSYKLKSKTGPTLDNVHADTELALQTLHQAMQKVIETQFSAESVFMKRICGIEDHEKIQEAVHQIKYMIGLIGHLVGLNQGAKFDPNAQVIYERILALSMQEMLQLYYEHVELQPIVALMRQELKQVLAQTTDPDDKQSLRSSFASVYTRMKQAKAIEDYDKWVSFEFKDDDDMEGELKEFSDLGVLRLMQHAGIVDEIDAALPW